MIPLTVRLLEPTKVIAAPEVPSSQFELLAPPTAPWNSAVPGP